MTNYDLFGISNKGCLFMLKTKAWRSDTYHAAMNQTNAYMYVTSLAQKKASVRVLHMSLVTVVAAMVCFNNCWVWQDKQTCPWHPTNGWCTPAQAKKFNLLHCWLQEMQYGDSQTAARKLLADSLRLWGHRSSWLAGGITWLADNTAQVFAVYWHQPVLYKRQTWTAIESSDCVRKVDRTIQCWIVVREFPRTHVILIFFFRDLDDVIEHHPRLLHLIRTHVPTKWREVV